jgi:type IV secretion system protein VirB10
MSRNRWKSNRPAEPPRAERTERSENGVKGERGHSFVSAPRSLQSRVSSLLACGLMLLLGGGLLTWYYTNALSRQARVARTAQSATLRRAQGEMPLPALEGFNSLETSSPAVARDPGDKPPHPAGETQQQPAVPSAIAPESLLASEPLLASSRPAGGQTVHKSLEQLTQERLLHGAAFSRESEARFGGASVPLSTDVDGGSGVLEPAADKSPARGASDGGIEPFLQPSATASARAKVLPTRRFLLSKGAFIDCTLETAIDSTLPGMTTCITATDTFGADGTVVLLERGTKLIGETRGQVHQGVARVFVLWTEARTPAGIVVPLDSPSTDESGRSGLPGSVNRHFWDRFGAAILISTLDGAVQAVVQSASRGSGPVIYNPTNPENVLTEVLKGTVNIPPTITIANGERIQVFVARDVDFREVYELRPLTSAP